MKTPTLVSCSTLLLFAMTEMAWADASDPGAARAQLQQGYALKQAGHCGDAIPHFLESVRLDRHPKALINLADCEQIVGKYVSAQAHLVEARDWARQQGLPEYTTLAEERLQNLEQTMPKLTLRLAKDAPADTVVSKDGVELRAISLGIPLPLDPGTHVVLARGGGLERQYDVKLADKESPVLEVTPVGGKPISSTASGPAGTASDAPAPAASADTGSVARDAPSPAATANTDSVGASSPGAGALSSKPIDRDPGGGPTLRTLGYVSAGVGAAGIVMGTVFSIVTGSKNRDAEALCTSSQPCDPDGLARYRDAVDGARSAQTLSIVGFAAGGVLLATGITLVMTTPARSSTAWHVDPIVNGTSMGLLAGRAW